MGDTNPCRCQAELQCAGHAPDVTNVQFTLGTCGCLIFYLASPVTLYKSVFLACTSAWDYSAVAAEFDTYPC